MWIFQRKPFCSMSLFNTTKLIHAFTFHRSFIRTCSISVFNNDNQNPQKIYMVDTKQRIRVGRRLYKPRLTKDVFSNIDRIPGPTTQSASRPPIGWIPSFLKYLQDFSNIWRTGANCGMACPADIRNRPLCQHAFWTSTLSALAMLRSSIPVRVEKSSQVFHISLTTIQNIKLMFHISSCIYPLVRRSELLGYLRQTSGKYLCSYSWNYYLSRA